MVGVAGRCAIMGAGRGGHWGPPGPGFLPPPSPSPMKEKVPSVVDALPYADAPPPRSSRDAVEALIAAEMGAMARSGVTLEAYEGRLPPVPGKREEGLFAEELRRVEMGKEKEKAIDAKRMEMDEPEEGASLEEWEKALENAMAQHEHTQNRLMNLELLELHGANAWKAHLEHLERTDEHLHNLLKIARGEVDAVNQMRERDHGRAMAELKKLEVEFDATVQRSGQIRAAIAALGHNA